MSAANCSGDEMWAVKTPAKDAGVASVSTREGRNIRPAERRAQLHIFFRSAAKDTSCPDESSFGCVRGEMAMR